MVLKTVDFGQFLSDSSDIPCDIKFLVIEEVFDEFTDEKFELDRKTVEAHKMLLSAASPVFRSLFYGKMKSFQNHFEIKETKIKAFDLFIKIIYGVENLNLDISDMFAILDLADFYIIESIKAKMIDAIKNEMTFENLKAVADAAATYIHHEQLAKKMLKNCGKFLQNNLRSSDQITEFLQDELMDPELIEQILDIKCENCDYYECKDGLYATFPEHKPLKPGVRVTKWVRTGPRIDVFDCTIARVSLGMVPPYARHNTPIEGSGIVLDVSDGTQMALPVIVMSNREHDHWYSRTLHGDTFLSTGSMFFRCKQGREKMGGTRF